MRESVEAVLHSLVSQFFCGAGNAVVPRSLLPPRLGEGGGDLLRQWVVPFRDRRQLSILSPPLYNLCRPSPRVAHRCLASFSRRAISSAASLIHSLSESGGLLNRTATNIARKSASDTPSN